MSFSYAAVAAGRHRPLRPFTAEPRLLTASAASAHTAAATSALTTSVGTGHSEKRKLIDRSSPTHIPTRTARIQHGQVASTRLPPRVDDVDDDRKEADDDDTKKLSQQPRAQRPHISTDSKRINVVGQPRCHRTFTREHCNRRRSRTTPLARRRRTGPGGISDSPCSPPRTLRLNAPLVRRRIVRRNTTAYRVNHMTNVITATPLSRSSHAYSNSSSRPTATTNCRSRRKSPCFTRNAFHPLPSRSTSSGSHTSPNAHRPYSFSPLFISTASSTTDQTSSSRRSTSTASCSHHC